MKRIIELNLILGVWLILAPFVLSYATGHSLALSNDVGVGVLLVACSFWILAASTVSLGVIAFEGICGIWLFVAPFVLSERAMLHTLANDVVVGALVLLISLADAWMVSRREHHATSRG